MATYPCCCWMSDSLSLSSSLTSCNCSTVYLVVGGVGGRRGWGVAAVASDVSSVSNGLITSLTSLPTSTNQWLDCRPYTMHTPTFLSCWCVVVLPRWCSSAWRGRPCLRRCCSHRCCLRAIIPVRPRLLLRMGAAELNRTRVFKLTRRWSQRLHLLTIIFLSLKWPPFCLISCFYGYVTPRLQMSWLLVCIN